MFNIVFFYVVCVFCCPVYFGEVVLCAVLCYVFCCGCIVCFNVLCILVRVYCVP